MEKITEAQVIRIDTKATGARIRELRMAERSNASID